MRRFHLAVLLLFFSTNIISTVFAQNTINSGSWTNDSHWNTGTAPGTTLSSGTININHRTILEGDITFVANGNTIINVTDTLIIVGDVIYQSNAGNNRINIGGVLIITGSLNSAGTVNIDVVDNTGIFIVAGNLNYNGGNPKGASDAEFYVNGTTNPPYSDSRWTNGGSPGSTGVQGDFSDLQANHPVLFNIVNYPLPIELSYFSASIKNDFFEFEWETIIEENNDFFTIEYSFDLKEYNILSKEDGAGNSLSPISYQVNEPVFAFKNTLYFRLKQTDYDGNYSYSQLVAVSNNGEFGSELKIYPNPTEGNTLIQLSSDNTIETLTGFVLSPATLQTVGTFTIENGQAIIDFSYLDNGVYFLNVIGLSKSPFKLMIQK